MVAGSGPSVGGGPPINESCMTTEEDYPVAGGVPFTGPPSHDSMAYAGYFSVEPHFSPIHDEQVVAGVSRAGFHKTSEGIVVDAAAGDDYPIAGGIPCRGIAAVEPSCRGIAKPHAVGDSVSAGCLASVDAAA